MTTERSAAPPRVRVSTVVVRRTTDIEVASITRDTVLDAARAFGGPRTALWLEQAAHARTRLNKGVSS